MVAERGVLRSVVFRTALALFAVASGVLLLEGRALASNRWSDISDAQWESGYGVTAAQVATVALGFTDGSFQPAGIVTQAQFVRMVTAGFHLENPAAAQIATEAFGAVDRSSFPVARQQANAMLASLVCAAELGLTEHITGASGDYDSLDGWYAAEGADLLTLFVDRVGLESSLAPQTAYLVLRGVVRGSPRAGAIYLDPAAHLTRAQAVTLILRAKDAALRRPRSVDPFVSTEWLEAHLGDEDVVVLDLRNGADYAAGHIPGAISVPFGAESAWATSGDLTLEAPDDADLLKVIRGCGIDRDSVVVLVGGIAQATLYPLVDTARVAATLVHGGIHNIAILQGTYARWSEEGRARTVDLPSVQPTAYEGPIDEEVFVTTEYVKGRLGRSVVVDTRAPDVYFGVTLDSSGKPGHIPTARCLPAQWLWQSGGSYVPAEDAQKLAAGVLGADKDQEIIVYCAVGGTASAWWYMLSQVLGYRDVKLYDGSAQAWVGDNDLSAYTWLD
jgi:thiosulfate/3-mercaptopyruvate sulfurtransferase